MVAERQKKYATGEGAQFMTRKASLKKLQLSLKDFRRLCILKGIYPREPRNRKKAQKGAGGIKTLYHAKDIRFLLHEPIVWKIRDLKVYNRRIRRAKGMREKGTMNRYLRNHPEIKIDHIVKERYPTFIDAVRDLDDCLTLCFLFSTFPSLNKVPRERTILCRRLTIEFMHAVIAAKALRYVFVSIKGYYYQAEIEGQTVNWIVPHNFGFQPQTKDEVDFRIMSTFVEFYSMMLGFVNFKLFNSLNIPYPPMLQLETVSKVEKSLVDEAAFVSEKIAAMNTPLVRASTSSEAEDETALDVFPDEEDSQKLEEAKREAEKVKKLKTLFKGLKFFLNREVPRESLVFILRCFGAEVSWDKMQFVGATFSEEDESITHQVVDRPSVDKHYISRYYVQPQWVFDSVNARALLPVSKYLIGETLPPHLSPFTDKIRTQVYIPPEAKAINAPEAERVDEAESDDDIEEASDEEKEVPEKKNDEGEVDIEQIYRREMEDESDSDEESDKDETSEEKLKRLKQKKAMKVSEGELFKEHPYKKEIEDKQAYRLKEMMVKRKYQKLYKSMVTGRKERQKEIWLLRKKRRLLDESSGPQDKKTKNKKKSEKQEENKQTKQKSSIDVRK